MPWAPVDDPSSTNPLAKVFHSELLIDDDAKTGNGWVSGCALTAQGTPNMTRALGSGVVYIAGQRITVNAQNTPVVTADATNPRWVLYEVDNTGTVYVVLGTPDATDPLIPSRTSGRVRYRC